jgi:hypothetical protein
MVPSPHVVVLDPGGTARREGRAVNADAQSLAVPGQLVEVRSALESGSDGPSWARDTWRMLAADAHPFEPTAAFSRAR